MDLIILCAGKGRRMGSNVPKALVTLGGKPLLEWQLEEVRNLFDKVFVVINPSYQNEFDNMKLKFNFVNIPQNKALGTWHAVRQLSPDLLDENFIVICGDCFYSKGDIKNLFGKKLALLARTPNPLPGGIVIKSGTKNIIEKILEKEGKTDVCNIGAYKFTKEIFSVEMEISKRGEYEITTLVNKLASAKDFEVIQAELWAHHTMPDDFGGVNNVREAYWRKNKVFVNILFVDGEKVLLQQRDEKPFLMYPGYWQIFGGLKNDSETEEECLVREIKEELDIDLKTGEFEKLYSFETERGTDVIFLSKRIIEEEANLFEGKKKRYFTKGEFNRLDIVPTDKFILGRVFE